ncbi:related to monocarboxylate transporter 2 [Cephalotrichum gorgonifer]|uniref:Related to monocarboxylate transporter 2 n=1 Tax=Cephalotrichum gorgonifer TaxID=2041049 RepID=A0AAE8SVT3_9PEZI|nr:related to monocarboxylate transporter 2 [Cephalotrichum gorgonifer]
MDMELRPRPQPQQDTHYQDSTARSQPSSDGNAYLERAPSPEDAIVAVNESDTAALPPTDGGKDAWLFLAACFMIEGLVWGFPFAFGVFQSYYASHEPFAGSRNIPVIGTCAMGIMYLDNALVSAVLRLYPRHARWAPLGGLFVMCLALAMSSFSSSVPHLIATQGVLYALGGSVAYCPCIQYMDEWFARRKGLAYGIMWSATGFGGVLIPLLLEFLLNRYGFRTTLRIWAGLLFALSAPLTVFIKPRLPIASATHPARPNVRFLISRTFMLHQVANIAEATGFFLPSIYLPTYAATYLGASSFLSTLTLLIVNVSSVFGCIVMGSLIDRFDPISCIFFSTVGTTIGVLVLWGLSSSLPVLYVFCVIYGFFAGSFTSTWPGVMKQVVASEERRHRGADPIMIFGWLAAGRGVGNIISGPLSEALVSGSPWKGQPGTGYGSGHGPLIVFTGLSALLGGATIVWKQFGWLT